MHWGQVWWNNWACFQFEIYFWWCNNNTFLWVKIRWVTTNAAECEIRQHCAWKLKQNTRHDTMRTEKNNRRTSWSQTFTTNLKPPKQILTRKKKRKKALNTYICNHRSRTVLEQCWQLKCERADFYRIAHLRSRHSVGNQIKYNVHRHTQFNRNKRTSEKDTLKLCESHTKIECNSILTSQEKKKPKRIFNDDFVASIFFFSFRLTIVYVKWQ